MNYWILVSFIISLIFVVAILLVPSMQTAFYLTNLSSSQLLITVGLALMSIIQVEIAKLIKNVNRNISADPI